ncbi:unnamed protein product [Xylocopa violacea]|uniref:Uncharacterized protein n=1 Tax=Xylocopa violacea TaxID=135666 RepID=A0ABP1PFF8_XYLVO
MVGIDLVSEISTACPSTFLSSSVSVDPSEEILYDDVSEVELTELSLEALEHQLDCSRYLDKDLLDLDIDLLCLDLDRDLLDLETDLLDLLLDRDLRFRDTDLDLLLESDRFLDEDLLLEVDLLFGDLRRPRERDLRLDKDFDVWTNYNF